jgi:hypothetical protein
LTDGLDEGFLDGVLGFVLVAADDHELGDEARVGRVIDR